MTRPQELYSQLQDVAAVMALVGEAEDAHLDCKEWPTKDDDAQKMLAKAATGLTNADGGVLVIGMKAESRPKDEPDLVTGPAPVFDTSLVKSRVLGLISNLVEPGIVGIEAREIADQPNSKTGFVVVYVPKSEGSPRRSRKDSKFYQRIGSATLPMEYWQIEVMFGKRPNPKLSLHLEVVENRQHDFRENKPLRSLVIGLRNDGLGIAKFPGLRFKRVLGLRVDMYGIDGNVGFGIPQRPSEPEWIVFRGGVDDVIYPGETRLIGYLYQIGEDRGIDGIPITKMPIKNNRIVMTRWVFDGIAFSCEVFCEGQPIRIVEQTLPDGDLVVNLPGLI
jgi:hypothetical protein